MRLKYVLWAYLIGILITLGVVAVKAGTVWEGNLPAGHYRLVQDTTVVVPPDTTPPPPDPDLPPPSGFASCGGNTSQAGLLNWSAWCTDEARNFTSPATSTMGMKCNAQAVRSRLPGAKARGVAPPTAGSNKVVMTCQIKWRQEWLNGIPAGGQHLFGFGEGPFLLTSGQESPDHIRFDFGCFNIDGAGNGFRDGFRVLCYQKKNGMHQEQWFSSSTKMPGVFVADQWTPMRIEGRYDPVTGRCFLDMTIGAQTRHAEITIPAGIVPRLGDSLAWGNVDHSSGQNDRPGVVELKDLVYSN